ncbi:MAG: TlpA family protein disulfide reductase [Chlorobiaceae bacterium]|nr:TlpA family protein disulfide reductase [Chlorobiaceae bacterium]
MKTTKFRLPAICAALLILFAGMTLSRSASAAPVKAPTFSGITIDGKSFSSASLAGKPYIVNFFATWCPPCRAEIPDMVAVQKAWAPKGFTFVGIAVNETVPAVQGFMKSNGMSYPVLMATPALVQSFNRYVDGGISGIPTTFVVDASGNLTGVIIGPRDKATFEQLIKASFPKKK